ncbi:MAG: sugar ABC transporter substrate-binding protein [Gemmataceae bacterium]|nr:sugar ABC transporter substrate-binding protein [Gemmataceae bacterium]
MRRVVAVCCIVVFAFLIGSCRETPDDGKKPKKNTKGTIGVSVLTMTNPFFKEIADVLTADMNKAGYDVVAVSGDLDVAKQQKQVQDFLVQKVSAIVLCPCDSKAIGPVIREANKQGVPVFTADIACLDPDAKVVTHVATDNYEGGKQAGEAMIEALGDNGGKILVLDFQKVDSCILRIKGFDEVLKKHNDGRATGKIKVVKRLPCDGEKDKGYRATQDTLQSDPDIVGIFAINDPGALGARAALERANKTAQIKIIGFDGQPEGKQAILEGKIYADPIQFPDKIAQETARAILRHFQGNPLGSEILIPTSLYRKADAEKDASLKK